MDNIAIEQKDRTLKILFHRLITVTCEKKCIVSFDMYKKVESKEKTD